MISTYNDQVVWPTVGTIITASPAGGRREPPCVQLKCQVWFVTGRIVRFTRTSVDFLRTDVFVR